MSSPPSLKRTESPALRFSDALSYSSTLAAAIGGALSLCASRLLGAPESGRSALLVMTGAFIVYSLDRLRDTERDSRTSPSRTAFVERHRTLLVAATGLAGFILLLGLFRAELPTTLLCVAIGIVGLFHRRLKRRAMLKTLYVSLAWTLGLVGLPYVAAPGIVSPESATRLATIFLVTLFANLIASNLRDRETEILRDRPDRALWLARFAAMSGIALAVLGTSPVARTAAWIPFAECLALFRFRPTERYGHNIVDGALLLGALTTLLHRALLDLGP